MNAINTRQNEIVQEFSLLEGNQEMMLVYLMELGQRLPAFPEEEKTDANLVKGCQSKVWLTSALENGSLRFFGDSNTAITKGLVSLLIRVFDQQPPDDVLKAELNFMHASGLDRFIGTQRSNGFLAMVKQFKLYALAFKTKQTV
jgi:cysteine desulfuration protein SufE